MLFNFCLPDTKAVPSALKPKQTFGLQDLYQNHPWLLAETVPVTLISQDNGSGHWKQTETLLLPKHTVKGQFKLWNLSSSQVSFIQSLDLFHKVKPFCAYYLPPSFVFTGPSNTFVPSFSWNLKPLLPTAIHTWNSTFPTKLLLGVFLGSHTLHDLQMWYTECPCRIILPDIEHAAVWSCAIKRN